jgi:hypothetical protein
MPATKRKSPKKHHQKITKKNLRGGFSMSGFLNKEIQFDALRRNIAARFGQFYQRPPPKTATENIKAATDYTVDSVRNTVDSVRNTVSFGKSGGTRKRGTRKRGQKKRIITR